MRFSLRRETLLGKRSRSVRLLYGLTRALPLPICGEIGSLCAAEIIRRFGARREVDLVTTPGRIRPRLTIPRPAACG